MDIMVGKGHLILPESPNNRPETLLVLIPQNVNPILLRRGGINKECIIAIKILTV